MRDGIAEGVDVVGQDRAAGEPARRGWMTGVTAIVPALDEEHAIAGVVEALRSLGAEEVFVVYGGLCDATASRAVAAGARVVVETRRGYGRACLTGAEQARDAEVLLFVDGDGSDVVEQAGRLVEAVLSGHADLAIGSRIRGRRQRGSMGVHQLAGNMLVACVLRWRHGVAVTDVGPCRAVRAGVLRALGMREMSYGWPTEMIVRAAARGYRVVEVPVDYRARAGGHSKVSGSVRASSVAGWHMLRVASSTDPTGHEKKTAREEW